ncbi:hypothetical protein [uncultured Serinicoccus sp.]|uniref:hypothetical protein n=1 Tax=uncultured Serinicoccus sp. TaxID=735514 RepID=UPI0026254C88|nr:hypothetical protein [uncultured Serinicoccus sp.]
MSYGNPPAPRRSGLTTAGKWMFIIGLVLSVIVGIGVAWGGVQGARMFSDLQGGGTPIDEGQTTVSMEEGDLRLVTAEGSQTPTCTVTGPDGTESALTQDSTFDTGDQQVDAQLVGTYQATATGEHTFTCEGGTASLSPSISIGSTIGLAVAGLGILALIPLLLLTGIGLILWLVGRSRDRKAADGPPGGYGYGTAYPQQGYGQPQDSGYPQAPGQGYGQQYGQGSPPRPPGQDPTDPYRRD